MNMEDLLSDVGNKAELVIGAGSTAVTWIVTKMAAWKAIESKPLKIAIAVGLFLAVAVTLSLITAPFT